MALQGVNGRRLISYIFPIYNEEGNIKLLYDTISGVVAQAPEFDFEFIFINDGSRDRSLELIVELSTQDSRIRVLDFSRNFGHQAAVTAGLDKALGDAVIIMDSDLQDPPEVSLKLIEQWQQGFDVVYARRASRKDSFFKRWTANLYYRVLRQLSEVDIPRNTGDFRLLDRAVVEELKGMREHSRFLRGMVSFVGFRQTAVLFDRDERHAGVTGYPLRRMIRFAIDGILGFSSAPLRLITHMGFFFSFISFLGIVYALVMWLFFPEITVEGWTFMVISVLLMGGVQLVTIGVIGQYIGRIYTEVQNRPLYIIKTEYGDSGAENPVP